MPIVIKRKVVAPTPEPVVELPKVVKREKKQAPQHLDVMCMVVLNASPNGSIPWWLMASYLYYTHDVALLSDGLYDEMARAMLEAWDELEHMHKHLITVQDLKMGSLYRLHELDYPNMTKAAAVTLTNNHMGMKLKYLPT